MDNAARGGSGWAWQKVRQQILERDSYSCQECGAYATEVDHLTPLHQGGRTEMHNLQALCHDHHRQKTARQRT